jgi:hypothetical protein
MLILEVSSKKPKPAPYTPPPFTPTPPSNNNITTEVWRRAGVVTRLVNSLKYKEGDICITAEAADRDKYGDIRVLSIARSYQQLGKDYEWRNDNPMLVYATSLKDSSKFFCTVNFLEKKE